MSENVSNVMTLAGKARADILAAQEAVAREVASRGYWESQLAASLAPLRAPAERKPRPRRAGRVTLTYGVAHRLYRARVLYDWSASRAAEALGIPVESYRNFERRSPRGADDEPISVMHRGVRALLTADRGLLVKASRVYSDPYFKEFVDAHA